MGLSCHSCYLVRAVKAPCSISNLWKLVCIFLVLTFSLRVTGAVSQQPSGFISIDCGGVGGEDPRTDLKWVTDQDFLDSASQLRHENVTIRANVELNSSTASTRDNVEQLKTAMVFLPGRSSRSKYCYTLNVTLSNKNSTNYLVRAMFPSRRLKAIIGGEDLNSYGSRFYFIVDSTFITTVELDKYNSQTVEMVVNSLDDLLHICLVPLEDMSSMAAISTLELRPLLKNMYGRDAQSNTASESSLKRTTYLMTIDRLNFGGNESVPALRYPSDIYDRLWLAGRIPDSKTSQITSKRNPNFEFNQASQPSEVITSAWEAVSDSSELQFDFNIREARSRRPLSTFVLIIMLFDVDPGENSGQRFVDIIVEDNQKCDWVSNAAVPNDTFSRWYNYKQTFSNDSITFTIKRNGSSVLPAMVNSAELLGEFESITERTAETDASNISRFTNIFQNYTAVDTAGDPCLPVPWSWLVCNIEVPPRITQIDLTNKCLGGELPAEFGSLNSLTVLDLSNNNFSGGLPQTLTNIVTLRALSISNNNLGGTLPDFKERSLVNLEIISLCNNSLSGSLFSLVKALDTPVSRLDLSNNEFGDSIPAEIGLLRNLKSLNLSFNLLTGSLPDELFELPEIVMLSLQNNSLEGMVPDLNWTRSGTKQVINLGGNNFTGLNLTGWVQPDAAFQCQHEVTLVDNQIAKVILPTSQDGLDILCTSPRSAVSLGIYGFTLLGRNPWCDNLVPSDMTLMERYLCRSSKLDDFCTPRRDSDSSKRTLIIFLLVSGFVIFLLACVVVVFLWRMWRRITDLRQIQEALAKDDVRPPFYKYEDLKAATKEFSKENELGKGAFGSVYKAELADKSIVAVKLLSPTEQNISDFLKEMVLITGIKHRHLVQLKGCCVRDKKRMLIYEYAENRNLAQALWGNDRSFVLTWAQRLKICVGIAKGLAYLHEELQTKIIHRDIKPPNILLDKDWNPKIADFGLARPVEEDAIQMATRIGGTLGYFSPEYATQGLLTEKLDVYSYGILVLEIVSGRRCIDPSLPLEEVYLKSLAFKLYKEGSLARLAETYILATVPGEEIESMLKTALSCLQENHEKRPSMSHVVNLLTGDSADVGIDIVSELRDQQLLYESLFVGRTITSYNEGQEKEDLALLCSTSSNDPKGFIELSATTAR